MKRAATAKPADYQILLFPYRLDAPVPEDKDSTVATRKDISDLRTDIKELRSAIQKPSYFTETFHPTGIEFSAAPVMCAKPNPKPDVVLSPRMRGRAAVSLLSAFLGGGILAISVFLQLSIWSRLFFLCLALPAVGTGIACWLALTEGTAYDDSE